MHYHLEIVMPPVDNVEEAIEQIMEPFNENGNYEDTTIDYVQYRFWDWYVIGGRWSGVKLEAMLNSEKLKLFKDELSNKKVTVSTVTVGKETLEPSSQIPMVDALWNEFFPESSIKVCPLFSHFNNQYMSTKGFPDIMLLRDMPKDLKASHVIIAGNRFSGKGLQARYMNQESMWNGVTWVKSQWNGLVESALNHYYGELNDSTSEYRRRNEVKDDWLVVTVDYHS